METISVDHSRKGMGVLLVLGTIMFGMSLLLLYLGLFTNLRLSMMGSATSSYSILIGSIGSLFFGYAFFFILYRFLFPKGAMIINDKGVIDQTSAIGSKHVIPYEHMENVKLEIIHQTPYIGITLNNDPYINNLPWIKRKTKEINEKYFGTSMVSINPPVESREHLLELIDLINERREIFAKQMTR